MSSIRELERASIRRFLESNMDRMLGKVLDYGAGRQPYKDIVERAGGSYDPLDHPSFPASVVEIATPYVHPPYDACVHTQVVQYAESPQEMMQHVRSMMAWGAWLLMTGPTNWPVVETADRWRFTANGASALLESTGFWDVRVQERAHVQWAGETWCLGWQAVARA